MKKRQQNFVKQRPRLTFCSKQHIEKNPDRGKVGSEIKIAMPTIGPTQQTGFFYKLRTHRAYPGETTKEKPKMLLQMGSSPGRHNPHFIHEREFNWPML